MKFLHISDLHIGKRVNGFTLIEDQKYVFDEIIRIVGEEKPDGLLLAGDIYDTRNPSEEAVMLFSDILTKLSELTRVYIISGNHDSDEKLSFASPILQKANVFISPVFDGAVSVFDLEDESGKVHIHLLPFIKPLDVRRFYPDRKIESYDDAVRAVLENHEVNKKERNILLSHQFVTGAATSESEELSIGGSENIGSDAYGDYDYVALGHLHRPQRVKSENEIRYAGSPLKYSFSEENDHKSISRIVLGAKGDIKVDTIELSSLHGMHTIRGTYDEVMARKFYEGTTYQNDYLRIVLTDEDEIPDAMSKLRNVYPYTMIVEWEIRNRSAEYVDSELTAIKSRNPFEIIRDFYRMQNDVDMTERQEKIVKDILDELEGGER